MNEHEEEERAEDAVQRLIDASTERRELDLEEAAKIESPLDTDEILRIVEGGGARVDGEPELGPARGNSFGRWALLAAAVLAIVGVAAWMRSNRGPLDVPSERDERLGGAIEYLRFGEERKGYARTGNR